MTSASLTLPTCPADLSIDIQKSKFILHYYRHLLTAIAIAISPAIAIAMRPPLPPPLLVHIHRLYIANPVYRHSTIIGFLCKPTDDMLMESFQDRHDLFSLTQTIYKGFMVRFDPQTFPVVPGGVTKNKASMKKLL
ncbi:hypothetical protein IV203_011327 [Nitzschia inconspicua]|uniref:Uncharacterized protein n=1 Tax=Nitzschia inconspicua TaxID=303405 RepID=A0A9K3PIR8_9STRA|nr:hypothetical protein IV203_011327 [Nitzschia inconspicua]